MTPHVTAGGDPRAGGAVTDSTDTREQILEAAEGCFVRYGIQKTTLDDVAAGVGISRATIYRHFPSRTDLILAVLERHYQVFADQFSDTLLAFPTFGEKIVGGLINSVAAGHRDPIASLFYAEHSVSLLSQIVGSAATLRDAALIQWAPTLRAGVASGEARPDLDVRQGCYWLLEVQFILSAQDADREYDVARMRTDLERFVLPGFLPSS